MLIDDIKSKAKKSPKRIVFPESEDDRILKAVDVIIKEKIAKPIILGSPKTILEKANSLNIDLSKAEIIDHSKSPDLEPFIKKFFDIRKEKGITMDQAKEKMLDKGYFGTMMVHMKKADGLISGAIHSTGDTVLPALQIIKGKKGSKVSGVFIMIANEKVFFFADTAVQINPSAEELSDIALSTAQTAKTFGFTPKVAMLSFSTKGSAKHELVNKVTRALELAKKKDKKLLIDGEMQVDAALVPEVAKLKFPGSKVAGSANILIFPDLQSGNIGYKLVERLANAKAIGPVLQGLNKPVNDLSRGCSVSDIVDLTAITVVQAQKNNNWWKK